jgi:hypothetical protein
MILLFVVCLVLGLRGDDMNKLERLNNGSSAVFKHDNGTRCIVQHVYGNVCTYSVTIYAKSKRSPCYGTHQSRASDAIKYVNGLEVE